MELADCRRSDKKVNKVKGACRQTFFFDKSQPVGHAVGFQKQWIDNVSNPPTVFIIYGCSYYCDVNSWAYSFTICLQNIEFFVYCHWNEEFYAFSNIKLLRILPNYPQKFGICKLKDPVSSRRQIKVGVLRMLGHMNHVHVQLGCIWQETRKKIKLCKISKLPEYRKCLAGGIHHHEALSPSAI